MNVILLNPPGRRRYVRSYYCGSTSKSGYLFQPLDLLMLSGIIMEEHDISVVDCVAEKLTPRDAVKRVAALRPEVAVCLVSVVSWEEDVDFLRGLKKEIPSLKVIANGDVFFEEPERTLREIDCIDAVIFDFISRDIVNYVRGDEGGIRNMAYKRGDEVIVKKADTEGPGGVFSIPMPRHELFLNKSYRFPFARRYPFTTVLTSFGCPFQCSFCIANRLGFKYRRAEEVMEELRSIWRLGVQEIFFEDMSFGLPRENAVNLCAMMIKEGLGFGWSCFSRVDLVDEGFLALMKKAGCHTIIFGVESADEGILRAHRKGYARKQIIEAFRMCRRLKIRTAATFIIGLPEETRETCLKTIRFARELGCDYASFNVAVPRPGTELRLAAIRGNLIREGELIFDHSANDASMPSRYLSEGEIGRLKRRAVIEFYFRPSYVLRRLAAIRSFSELREHISGCIGLAAGIIFK